MGQWTVNAPPMEKKVVIAIMAEKVQESMTIYPGR
jgi:hypothetical protein